MYERLDEAVAPLRAGLRAALVEGAALASPECLADRVDPSALLGAAGVGAALAAAARALRRLPGGPGARRALSTAGKLGAGTFASLTGALLIRRFWRARSSPAATGLWRRRALGPRARPRGGSPRAGHSSR